jgi:drug/metabolite transporter (DMT)-like permease
MVVLLRRHGVVDMHVILGGGLLVGGLLVIAVLAYLFGRPHNPRWVDHELTAMLLSILPTAMVGLGAGYTLMGLLGDHRPIDLLALLGWLAIGFGLIWLVRRRRALLLQAAKAPAEAGSGVLPPGSGGPHRTA